MYNEKLTKVKFIRAYNLTDLEEKINDFCVKELPAKKDIDEKECIVRDIKLQNYGSNFVAMIIYGDRD